MTSSVADCMRAITAERLGIEPNRVTDDARFGHELGDSLDTVELFMEFESRLGVELDDNVIEACQTFGDAVRAVATVMPAAAQ